MCCSLHENFLAVGAMNSVQVVQLNRQEGHHLNRSLDESYDSCPEFQCTSYELSEDEKDEWVAVIDKDFKEIQFDGTDSSKDSGIEKYSQPSLSEESNTSTHEQPLLITLPSIDSQLDEEIENANSLVMIGPTDNIKQYPVTVRLKTRFIGSGSGGEDNIYGLDQYLPKYYLFRKFAPVDVISSVELIPTYCKTKINADEFSGSEDDALKSQQYDKLIGLSCFISSRHHGYMYNILDHPILLSSYNYIDKVRKVVIDENFIHAISETGLTTYSSRHYLAPMRRLESFNDISETVLYEDIPPCVLGRLSFKPTSIEDICSMGDGIVLLCKCDGEYCLNALKKKSPEELCNEIQTEAASLSGDKIMDSHQLLQEAWLLLLYQDFKGQTGDQDRPTDNSELIALKKDVCGRLGDYYALPYREEWKLTLPFYLNSGRTLDEIILPLTRGRAEFYKSQDTVSKGLEYFVKYVVFESDKKLDHNKETGNGILSVVSKEYPQKLSQVILSKRLKDYSPDEALRYLKTYLCTNMPNQEDYLALKILHLKVDELSSSSEVSVLDPCENSEINFRYLCQKYPDQFVDKATSTPTDFMWHIRRQDSQIFVQLLTVLLKNSQLTFDEILNILPSGDSKDAGSVSLQEFLESVLSDDTQKNLFDKAGVLLCDIYMSDLMNVKAPGCRTISGGTHKHEPTPPVGLFAKRFDWLDQMKPFNGQNPNRVSCQSINRSSRPVKTGVTMETCRLSPLATSCPCCCCNDTLLKLQSLLCSMSLTYQMVQSILDKLEPLDGDFIHIGRESLYTLCLLYSDVSRAVDYLIDHNPEIIPLFARMMLPANIPECSRLVFTLCEQIQSMNDDDRSVRYTQVFKDLLESLCKVLPPSDFLHLLPDNGNFIFFVPYIEDCIKVNERALLNERIVNTAKSLEMAL